MSSSAAVKRQYRPRQCARLSGFLQKVQRNGLFEGERPGAGTPQHGDVADGSKRMGDVAGERADVGAFGDGGVRVSARNRSSLRVRGSSFARRRERRE